MNKVLELKLENDAKESLTLRINNPKEDLTEVEVQAGIQAIAATGVFTRDAGPLTNVVSARMVETVYTDYTV